MIEYKAHPKTCWKCGGDVELVDNVVLYGSRHGAGLAYRCTKCGMHTGVHKGTHTAVGVLADAEMRALRMQCHSFFDEFWIGAKDPMRRRRMMYERLAKDMGLRREDCHFGYFDKDQLLKARAIVTRWSIEQIYGD